MESGIEGASPAEDRGLQGLRVLGIDMGERRIGLALSDPSGIIASPYATWEGRDRDGLPGRIRHLVQEKQIGTVVIGLPNRTDGKFSEKAAEFRAFAEELRGKLDIPVEMIDESYTTVMAHEAMKEAGMKEKKRRQKVDEIAAVIILQSWLDTRKRPFMP